MDPRERGRTLRGQIASGSARFLSAAALAALERLLASTAGSRDQHTYPFSGNALDVITIQPRCTVGFGSLRILVELDAGIADVLVVRYFDLDFLGRIVDATRLAASSTGPPRRWERSYTSDITTSWQVRVIANRDGTAGRVACEAHEDEASSRP
jgi:hypothetical protein